MLLPKSFLTVEFLLAIPYSKPWNLQEITIKTIINIITNSMTVIVMRISTHLTVFLIIHNLNRGNCTIVIVIIMVVLTIIVIIIIMLVIIIRNILIISILKSLVIPAVWLVLNSVIYSQITLTFALKHICSKSHHWSVLKSHHFLNSISHHFCFEYKMWCKSLFARFSTNRDRVLNCALLVVNATKNLVSSGDQNFIAGRQLATCKAGCYCGL